MLNLSKEENKLLVEYFPFLQPRNVWTDKIPEDYDYDYILGVGDLPYGWERLFLLYAKHLKVELDKFNFTNKFRFSQIKEKYGDMRLYNNGYPKDSKCLDLEYIYSHLSTYVCQECGKPAKYESRGWIAQECEEHKSNNSGKKGNRKYCVKLICYRAASGREERVIPCKNYWDEYIKCLKMTKEKFLQYIMTDDRNKIE